MATRHVHEAKLFTSALQTAMASAELACESLQALATAPVPEYADCRWHLEDISAGADKLLMLAHYFANVEGELRHRQEERAHGGG
jgi:hypothetical protein